MAPSVFSAPSLKITTRCILSPSIIEVHSYPEKAENLPGSLCLSAVSTISAHTPLKKASSGYSILGFESEDDVSASNEPTHS